MDGQSDRQIDRQIDGWMDGQIDGWMDGWTDGWMDGQIEGWMDGWIYRQIDRYIDMSKHLKNIFIQKYCSTLSVDTLPILFRIVIRIIEFNFNQTARFYNV